MCHYDGLHSATRVLICSDYFDEKGWQAGKFLTQLIKAEDMISDCKKAWDNNETWITFRRVCTLCEGTYRNRRN